MSIANMKDNCYIRKPNETEIAIMNRINRFLDKEYINEKEAPEAIIVETMDRAVNAIKSIADDKLNRILQEQIEKKVEIAVENLINNYKKINVITIDGPDTINIPII